LVVGLGHWTRGTPPPPVATDIWGGWRDVAMFQGWTVVGCPHLLRL
jgi:hypothetical protein